MNPARGSAEASSAPPGQSRSAPSPSAPAPAISTPSTAPLSPLSTPAPAPASVSGTTLSSGPVPSYEDSPARHPTPSALNYGGPGGVGMLSTSSPTPSGPPHHHHILPPIPLPVRKDTASSISTQDTTATVASTETNNTSYSADTSPILHQSIFSVKDGSDVSNTRRASRRRTGPLSQQSRERAALIRKLGACIDCRRRRVACHPSHHHMTWEELLSKYRRSHSPTIQDIAPSLAAGRHLSPSPVLGSAQHGYAHDPQEMDIDSGSPAQHGRHPLSEARLRTPLPSGPRLEKSLSLPGIESLKNDLQSHVSRMLSTASRSRYIAVSVLLFYWQEDDDVVNVSAAVRELAEVFDKFYHYTFNIQAIPSSADGPKSSWRWLARQINGFSEERDHRDVLKIVYYAGHTYLDGNREMNLASSRDMDKASTIRWSGIQQSLEQACSDTLVLMDAPYYPSTRMSRKQGVLEIIAASTSEDCRELDHCVFTRAIAEQLRTQATRLTPLSAAELHSTVFANYPKIVRDPNPGKEMIGSFPAPLHVMMSGNSRLASIYISPIYQNSPLRSSFAYENNPQLHFDIRLSDDNVDVDSWLEWLRLMPEGAKDVKVEGPFRPAFR